ncbi:hypothetical protein D4R51_02300 [bacterium]|nr:MAG: hypothetical protein D4R51_02300 [bacterium]
MLGVQGTGPHGRMRILTDSIRQDTEYLKSGIPRGKEKRELIESIRREKEEIKKLRARMIRAAKKKK